MRILVLNPGSSTLKFGLYSVSEQEMTLLKSGVVDRLGSTGAANVAEATEQVIAQRGEAEKPEAVGCRVVHGGERFVEPIRVTAEVLKEIRALSSLAPLHNPLSVDALETVLRLLPEVPAVAIFDTAFHRTLHAVARSYALPYELSEQHGLWRYGFHGIAHRNVSERLASLLSSSSLITCHLGSGASVCAIKDGQSMDTSMGLTPMEGLVMGTRSGDIDPGLILHLQNALGMSAVEIDTLLNKKSGLLGLSGVSSDLRDIEKAAKEGSERAELAMEVFAYRVAKHIGAYAVALEGLDTLAFSGGIGEHSAQMRNRICRRLAFLGLTLDDARNAETNPADVHRISADNSKVGGYIVPADENTQIARESYQLLRV